MKRYEYQSKNHHVKFVLDVESPRESIARLKHRLGKIKAKLHRDNKSKRVRRPFIDIQIEKSDGTKKEYKL